MHLKELQHRSPMRVFERSVHGGPGRGRLGVIAARPGVGKNAFLTGLAIDRMLRGERVLHVDLKQSVEHVRERYDELFADLARTCNLEERTLTREILERNRIIRSMTERPFDIESCRRAVQLLGEHVDFVPSLVMVGGVEFDKDDVPKIIEGLLGIVGEIDAELWMTARVPRLQPGEDWQEMPAAIETIQEQIAVAILLHPTHDAVRVRLLKDHDEEELADLDLDLDPTTLLLRQV
ncbi:MAG: hypothetical protein AAF533_28630 [Acidobacteriota bacterium]